MTAAKVWNGTTWVKPFFKYPMIWNGSQWVFAHSRVYNGSTWGGAASQTLTVTVGTSSQNEPYVGDTVSYGFIGASVGSINPTYATIVDGAPTIYNLYWSQFTAWPSSEVTYNIYLDCTGTDGDTITQDDIGPWTNMNIAGYNYSKSSAGIYVYGQTTSFTWATTSTCPFGFTVGATKTVTFS